MSTKRLFVAIPLPDDVKDELLSTIPTQHNRDIRWTEKENLHFTLSFLGDREESELEQIYAEIRQIAGDRFPFRMVFKGFKTMYKNRKPSMVWAVFRESPSYTEFAAEFGENLDGDKRNEPIAHVTLGRVKSNASKFVRTPKMQHIVPFELDIDKVELWESKFDDRGISYSILETFPMKPEPEEDEL
ncbi:RNA 2',3'-cyclic phosphodiesterase [bacterium]|nr:RNA 2',3'-cyclic phosphodiesterase [bacterium]